MKKKLVLTVMTFTLALGCLTGCGNKTGNIGITELNPVSDEGDVVLFDNPTGQEENAGEDVWYEDDNLTMDEIILKDTLQSKYDELIVKYRECGRDTFACEGYKVTDEFVKKLTEEDILTYEDFWSKVVNTVDSYGSTYTGDESEKYEAAFITAVFYMGFEELRNGVFIDIAPAAGVSAEPAEEQP